MYMGAISLPSTYHFDGATPAHTLYRLTAPPPPLRLLPRRPVARLAGKSASTRAGRACRLAQHARSDMAARRPPGGTMALYLL